MSKRSADELSSGIGVNFPTVGYNGDFLATEVSTLSLYTNTNNPKSGPALYDENLDHVSYSLLNKYLNNPNLLVERIILYAQNMSPLISKKFPNVFTEGDTVNTVSISIDTEPMEIQARGTVTDFITVSRQSEQMHLSLRKLNIFRDDYTKNTKRGVMLFNSQVRQLISSFIATQQLDVAARARYTIFAYNNPATLNPDQTLPTTIEEADIVRRLRYHESSKPLGMKAIASRVIKEFLAQDENLEGVFLSTELKELVFIKDDTEYSYISGNKYESNRLDPTKNRDIEFWTTPIISDCRDDSLNQLSLKTRAVTGSYVKHINSTLDMPFGRFRTRMTDMEKADWETNGFKKFTKRETFRKCQVFQACDEIPFKYDHSISGCRYKPPKADAAAALATNGILQYYNNNNAALPGHLNRAMILDFISQREDILQKVKVYDSNENMEEYACFVRVDGSFNTEKYFQALNIGGDVSTPNVMMVAETVGEVSKVLAKNEHIANIYKTAGARIFADFTTEDLRRFSACLNWIKETQKLPLRRDFKSSISGKNTVVADVEENRDESKSPSRAKMLVVNKFGGISYSGMNPQTDSNTDNIRNSEHTYAGFGNISGLFTIADELNAGILPVDEKNHKLIAYAEVFRKFTRSVLQCMPGNILADPRMCPLYHTAANVDSFTRSCIVLGYNITGFIEPLCFWDGDKNIGLNNNNKKAPQTEYTSERTEKAQKAVKAVARKKKSGASLDTPQIVELESAELSMFNEDTDNQAKIVTESNKDYNTDIYNITLTPFVCQIRDSNSENTSGMKTCFYCAHMNDINNNVSSAFIYPDDTTYFFHNFCISRKYKRSLFKTGKEGLITGNTLMGALPYINPRFPMIPNAVGLERAEEKIENTQDVIPYVNFYPNLLPNALQNKYHMNSANNVFHGCLNFDILKDQNVLKNTRSDIIYLAEYMRQVGKEDAYWAFQKHFGDKVPYLLAHLIFYPVSGLSFFYEKHACPVSTFEERWIQLATLPLREMIGGKLALFSQNSLYTLTSFCDNDIDTIFGAAIINPFQTQLNHNAVAYCKGPLGHIYHNNKLTTETDQTLTRESSTTIEMQFGAAWEYKRRARVMHDLAGSDTIGGNGAGWFGSGLNIPSIIKSNENPYVRDMQKLMYNPERIGNSSNMAVLTGMSACMGEEAHFQSINTTGYPDMYHYIGIMHSCNEFYQKRHNMQWDGLGFFAYFFDPHKRKNDMSNDFNFEEYNLEQKEHAQRLNTTCHPQNIRTTNSLDLPAELPTRHLLGYQGVNCYFEVTGQARIGVY
jgi:hypothetical protein